MRKRILALLTAGFMAFAPMAFAQPPEEDPSGGNGSNGNNGCQGIEQADENRDGNSDPGIDLVKDILDC